MKVDVAQNVYMYQVQMEDGEMISVTLDSGTGCNVWPSELKAGSSILKPPIRGLKNDCSNWNADQLSRSEIGKIPRS